MLRRGGSSSRGNLVSDVPNARALTLNSGNLSHIVLLVCPLVQAFGVTMLQFSLDKHEFHL